MRILQLCHWMRILQLWPGLSPHPSPPPAFLSPPFSLPLWGSPVGSSPCWVCGLPTWAICALPIPHTLGLCPPHATPRTSSSYDPLVHPPHAGSFGSGGSQEPPFLFCAMFSCVACHLCCPCHLSPPGHPLFCCPPRTTWQASPNVPPNPFAQMNLATLLSQHGWTHALCHVTCATDKPLTCNVFLPFQLGGPCAGPPKHANRLLHSNSGMTPTSSANQTVWTHVYKCVCFTMPLPQHGKHLMSPSM